MEKVDYKGDNYGLTHAFDFITQNALGNVVIANDTPTATTIKANVFVFYNNEMFIKLSNGSLYKFTLTPV